MKVSEYLKKLKDNPDDLSELANVIAQVQELEESVDSQSDQILKLQENNRKILKMVPIPGEEPEEEKKEEQPTIDDAVSEIRESLKGEM